MVLVLLFRSAAYIQNKVLALELLQSLLIGHSAVIGVNVFLLMTLRKYVLLLNGRLARPGFRHGGVLSFSLVLCQILDSWTSALLCRRSSCVVPECHEHLSVTLPAIFAPTAGRWCCHWRVCLDADCFFFFHLMFHVFRYCCAVGSLHSLLNCPVTCHDWASQHIVGTSGCHASH